MDKSNLIKRIISALILGPLALFAVYFGQFYLVILVTFLSWFSIFEFSRMLKMHNTSLHNLLLYIQAPFVHYFMFQLEFDNVFMIFLIFAIIQYLIELFRNTGTENMNNASSHFVTMYTILFPTTLIAIREMAPDLLALGYNDASFFIFLILLSIWACDTFAYIGGVNFGKHRLFPRVSPKKSIEGAIFGFIGSMAVAYVFHLTLLNSVPIFLIILVGVVVGIFGQIGDLIESLIKRNAGVKDSGDTIPGHGGVLDRIDSIIFVSPIIFSILYYIYIF